MCRVLSYIYMHLYTLCTQTTFCIQALLLFVYSISLATLDILSVYIVFLKLIKDLC